MKLPDWEGRYNSVPSLLNTNPRLFLVVQRRKTANHLFSNVNAGLSRACAHSLALSHTHRVSYSFNSFVFEDC